MNVTIINGDERVTLGSHPFGLTKDLDFSGLSANINILSTNGLDGGLFLNSKYNIRDVEIEGYIDTYKKDTEWVQQQRSTLTRICNPKEKLTFEVEENGDLYYFNGYATSFPIFKNDQENKNHHYHTFLIQVTCPDPYLYKEKKTLTFATITPTFSFPLEIGNTTLGAKKLNLIDSVYNYGIMDAPLEITIKAIQFVRNPYLLNVGTQEQIKINADLNAGDVIVIKSGTKKTVYLYRNGIRTNYFTKLDMSSIFLTLYKGDNVFRFGAESGEDQMEVLIQYQERLGGM